MAWTDNSWVITDGRIGVQSITEVSTTQRHPLGMIVRAAHATYGEGEFIYLKGVTNGAVHAWVTYNVDDGTTTLLAANAIGPVGVMMSALDAATNYGWVQISGKTIGKCKTQFADNGEVFGTSTGGSVDDASVAGDRVALAKGASTTTANTFIADFEIHRPFVDDRITES